MSTPRQFGQESEQAPELTSRRQILAGGVLAWGATWLGVKPAMAQDLPTSKDAEIVPFNGTGSKAINPGNIPTSEDAEIVPFGSEIKTPRPDTPEGMVSHTIILHGDWSRTKLVDGTAWGEGHMGADVWKTGPKTSGIYRLSLTALQKHPHHHGCWYFVVNLDLSDSKSDHIAAMFRYTHGRGGDGVFAAAFPFPQSSNTTATGR